MTAYEVKKLLCKYFGHRKAYYIESIKKKRLKNNVYKQLWDVKKNTQCKRCGKVINTEYLHRDLKPEEYLRIYAYEENN